MENYLIEDFNKALNNLQEVLKMEKTGIIRDAAIKRFELCFDLAWKTIKEYAKNEGIECKTPRECIKQAFQMNLLDYNEDWLEMVLKRNESVHLYDDESAEKLYTFLDRYAIMFQELFNKIKHSVA